MKRQKRILHHFLGNTLCNDIIEIIENYVIGGCTTWNVNFHHHRDNKTWKGNNPNTLNYFGGYGYFNTETAKVTIECFDDRIFSMVTFKEIQFTMSDINFQRYKPCILCCEPPIINPLCDHNVTIFDSGTNGELIINDGDICLKFCISNNLTVDFVGMTLNKHIINDFFK